MSPPAKIEVVQEEEKEEEAEGIERKEEKLKIVGNVSGRQSFKIEMMSIWPKGAPPINTGTHGRRTPMKRDVG